MTKEFETVEIRVEEGVDLGPRKILTSQISSRQQLNHHVLFTHWINATESMIRSQK